jgi:hypothetical protein
VAPWCAWRIRWLDFEVIGRHDLARKLKAMLLFSSLLVVTLVYLYWAIEITGAKRLINRSYSFRLEPKTHN